MNFSHWIISITYNMDMVKGSHRNSKTQFYDFPMILHDQQCNFHDYLMHRLHPPLLAASSPCKA